MKQDKLIEEKQDDDFIESLNLTPKKIKEDMEKMKEIEGFPKGDDDDILNLSNPPYYTAYPNPYIKAFIEKFGKKYDEKTDDYKREPFVGDESHGRTDSVYNIHFYHTKVPPQAISSYIEHYTSKGDVLLDFFCGSGMTGVASLRLGRNCILGDLSPFASFISAGNCNDIDIQKFKEFSDEIFREVYNEVGWVYQVKHLKNSEEATFYIWSSQVECPQCKNNIKYIDLDQNGTKICPHCHSAIPEDIERIDGDESFVCSEACFNKDNKRSHIKIQQFETDILQKIDQMQIPYWYPDQNYMLKEGEWGDTWRKGVHKNFSKVSDFFFKRTLYVLSCIFDKIGKYNIEKSYKIKLIHTLTAAMSRLTKLNRYMPQHNRHVGPLSGTMYIPKIIAEINVLKNWREKIDAAIYADYSYKELKCIISTQSATDLSNIPSNSIDYVFVDPPFGDNLLYAELNFIFEVWLKITTNTKDEAIVSATQNKSDSEYQDLMYTAFKEAFRLIKPDRWITVEFHNSKASIWRCIQESINKSGFVIGQVIVLDKQKGTIKQLTSPGAVKNDLVINAYKPSEIFRNSFLKKAGLNLEHDFIKMHLDKLPIEPNIERTQQMLYSKLLAQYIQNGFEVRMDASEFYGTLRNHFTERDNFWFNSDQIKEYEKRLKLKQTVGKADLDQTIIGINDEKTAIIWLASFLRKPRTYDEIYIEFSKKIMTSEDKIPELKIILEENFVTENDMYQLPSQCQKKEREVIRIKRLMREFQDLIASAASGKKITEVRKDALLVGLMKLYLEKNVDQIKLLAKKLDKKIVQSDDDINAIIDWAMAKGD